MSGVAKYVFTLVCGAILCAVVLSISPEGAGAKMRRMIAGLFLVTLAVAPLGQMKLSDLGEDWENFTLEAQSAARAGENQAFEAMVTSIKSRTEAYILDEAGALGARLQAEVQVNAETFLPEAVRLEGEYTPYARQALACWIEDTLGIGKEAQQWTR